ncbi:MAG: lipopolysaccharide biosynthesis protein RfbH [Rickettsiales bacterium]|nr:lipopolysaccharide biosynthesis protein RfbH [Rickettsiales bacterium]
MCEKYGLWLIEDACDALGTTFNKKKVGTFGDFGTLSFYPAHHITMGEGGAVFTNNLKLKKIAESFRDWGRDCFCEPGVDNTCQRRFCWKLGELPKGYDHKYIYSHSGFNLKITEMQAACGLGQIKKINRFTKARKSNFNFYLKKFKKLEEFFILPKKTTFSDPSWFGFPITIRDNNTEIRNNLMKCLEEKRIGARLLFAGNITKQPYFKNQEYRIIDTLENTDKIMHDTLWLGVYPGLNHEMLSYVYETISLFVKKLKK